MTMTSGNPIYVAIDRPDLAGAVASVRALKDAVGGVKLGLEFFGATGRDGVRAVVDLGLPVFLDLKFHDIPNTVAGAVREAAGLGVAVLNVHAAGGAAMMRAAADAVSSAQHRPRLLAVTVLTSLDETDLAATGIASAPADQALRLARLAQASGMDGVVCSPAEIATIRAACGLGFTLVVPGIRPTGSQAGDQKRIMTPAQALAAGADILVIGRPITEAADPRAAAMAILDQLVESRVA